MTDDRERRCEHRLNAETTVFLEYFANGTDHSEPRIILCNTLDISRSGIQIELDTELPVGGVLRLCIDHDVLEKPLFLVAEVRWCRRSGETVHIGFELFDAEMTDVDDWERLVRIHNDTPLLDDMLPNNHS